MKRQKRGGLSAFIVDEDKPPLHVASKLSVRTHQGGAVANGLRYDKAVAGVAVVFKKGQGGKCLQILFRGSIDVTYMTVCAFGSIAFSRDEEINANKVCSERNKTLPLHRIKRNAKEVWVSG